MIVLPSGATILQVLPRLDSGGVERGTLEIAQAVRDAGAKAVVASAGGRLAPLLRGRRSRSADRFSPMPWARPAHMKERTSA